MSAQRRFYLLLVLLICGTLVAFFWHLTTGFHYYTPGHILAVLLGGGTEEERLAVFDFRMVRSLLAVLVGMGLALSGLIFQTASRNELASPGLLGVNAGAGLFVLALLFFVPESDTLGLWAQPMAAVLGGILAAGTIYRITYRKGRQTSAYTLVLNGIAVSAGIHALQMLLIVMLDPNKFHSVNVWLVGSIFGSTWDYVSVLAPILFVLFLLFLAMHETLDLLSFSDGTAIGLGVALERSRLLFLAGATVLAAACVAASGAIGFIGLICPHIARSLVGASHRRVLPVTALVGALLLLLSDEVARIIIAPDEMLVGLIVALIGAPYFLYLLARGRKEGANAA